MIALEIPVEKIKFIRTIEGRRFKNGKWEFPDSSVETLKRLGLVNEDYVAPVKEIIDYPMSNFLRGYQKRIVNLALNEDGYGIFMDTGTGKTVVALEIASHVGKTLVICPLSVIETAWIDDCHRFYPELKIINCHGNTRAERARALYSDADIYVINYESFKIVKNEIIGMGFECMIVDESACMKNLKSQITGDILSMVDVIPRRYVLSGAPNPNSNLELFPQMKFVQPDLFGVSYYGWRTTYFHQDWTRPDTWFQTQDDKDRLFARLSNGCVFLRKEDCIDLPPKVFETKRFPLDEQQKIYYGDIVQDIQDNINSWTKFEFTGKLIKLREIISGFIINKDNTITDFHTNKHRLLKQILDEIGNKPIIVWCQFRHEIETLAEKFNGIALTSQTKNRDSIIRKFKNNEIKLLFTHPKLLGKGLTFTNCTYNIYYSLSFSYEEFKQSQDRIHRIGQNNKCTYVILQSENTIDEKIYECLERKGDIVSELFTEMGLLKEK